MAPQSTQPLCTSKRKREAVVYYESSSSESEEDLSPTKKSKRSPTTSTRPLPKHKIFPFTTLPPELRNRIYALCLTDPNGIDLASKMRAYRRTVSRTIIARDEDGNGKHTTRFMDVPAPDTSELPVLAPHLLRLNKEIHAEAQPILYGGNVFALEDTMALHAFLATIGSENCASLLEVEIMGWGFTKAHKAMNHPAFTLLKEAVNLRRLRLACRVRYWGDITQVARAIYRDGYHWFDAVGRAKGKRDAGLDLFVIDESNLFESASFSGGVNTTTTPAERLESFQMAMRKFLA